MKVLQATCYAVTALVHLTRQGGSQLVASHVIAEAEGIPEAFLRTVLERLASTRLLYSLKGPTGGFRLARPAGRITLLEVVEAVEGPIRGSLDFEGTDAKRLEGKLQAVCDRAAEEVRQQYRRVTVADLAGKG
jgi:Rrf2 family protein